MFTRDKGGHEEKGKDIRQTKAGNASALVSGLGRSGYVFWNAAIQGTTNFGRQVKRHPAKSFTGIAAMFLLGANGYADLVRGMGYLRVKMDDELSDIFAFILSSDKVSAEDAKIIREFKADTDTGKTSVYQEKMGELRIKYDELFKEFSSMQQDYILKKIIAGYLGTDQGLFFDLQKMMKYAQKISDFTPLTVHDFEEIRKMSDPYYLGRLTKMNNRLLETIEANKKKKGYTVNESGEVKDEDLFYSIISKFKGKVILVDFWATWCGPCKMAMKQMKPMKKDLEGKDIVYVFIAGENSPKETWDNMIPDIHGEHYRVTAAIKTYKIGRAHV